MHVIVTYGNIITSSLGIQLLISNRGLLLVNMATDFEHGYNDHDIEMNTHGARDDLYNNMVNSFSWDGITVTVKDRTTGQPRQLLADVDGVVKAGEMLAMMGPR